MNSELKELLIELLKRADEICDNDFFYGAEYRALLNKLTEQ